MEFVWDGSGPGPDSLAEEKRLQPAANAQDHREDGRHLRKSRRIDIFYPLMRDEKNDRRDHHR